MEKERRRGRDREKHTQDSGTSVVEPFTNVPFLIYMPQKMLMVSIMVTTAIPLTLFSGMHYVCKRPKCLVIIQSSLSVTPSL